MLALKFKISKKGKLYVLDEWITNGHWAFRKEAVPQHLFKGLSQWMCAKNGRYEDGIMYDEKHQPDMSRVVPTDLRAYVTAKVSGALVEENFSMLRAFKLVSENPDDTTFANIAPEYVSLLGWGLPMIKGAHVPIVVRANDSPAVIAIIMPVRP